MGIEPGTFPLEADAFNLWTIEFPNIHISLSQIFCSAIANLILNLFQAIAIVREPKY
jgi:hypothetical protein